jgi:hypothetical protein
MKIKNISQDIQAIPNMPEFKPGEEREVTEEQGSYLLANPYFESIVTENSPKKGPRTEPATNFVDRKEGETL